MSRTLLCSAGVVLVASLPVVARAQQPRSEAELLFREAKAEVERGELSSACAKLERSWELSGVRGALLSWADCEERRGELGVARALWQRGEALLADDPERQRFARARVEALDEALSRLSPEPRGTGSSEGARPERASPPEPPTPAPIAPAPAEAGPSALVVGGWVSAGVGAAAAIVFGATGGAVLANCEDGTCPADYQGVLVGNAVSAGLGGLGLALGAAMLGVGYGNARTNEPGAGQVAIGPGPAELGLGLGVSF